MSRNKFEPDLTVRRAFRIAFLLAIIFAIMASLPGCATVEQFSEDHPQAVVGVELGALAIGGVMMGKAIAKSGRTQVVAQPRRTLGPL
jgi:hypothetical protein